MQSLQILSSAYNLDGNIRDEDCKQFTSSAFASSSMLVRRTIDLFIFTNCNEKYLSIDFDVSDRPHFWKIMFFMTDMAAHMRGGMMAR